MFLAGNRQHGSSVRHRQEQRVDGSNPHRGTRVRRQPPEPATHEIPLQRKRVGEVGGVAHVHAAAVRHRERGSGNGLAFARTWSRPTGQRLDEVTIAILKPSGFFLNFKLIFMSVVMLKLDY